MKKFIRIHDTHLDFWIKYFKGFENIKDLKEIENKKIN
jgi:hypothetical protein